MEFAFIVMRNIRFFRRSFTYSNLSRYNNNAYSTPTHSGYTLECIAQHVDGSVGYSYNSSYVLSDQIQLLFILYMNITNYDIYVYF